MLVPLGGQLAAAAAVEPSIASCADIGPRWQGLGHCALGDRRLRLTLPPVRIHLRLQHVREGRETVVMLSALTMLFWAGEHGGGGGGGGYWVW